MEIYDNYVVRPAREADLPGILDLYNYNIINTTNSFAFAPLTLDDRKKWLEEHERDGYPIIVAQEKSKETIIGYCSLSEFRRSYGYRKTAETSLYVHKDYQAKGIGRLLTLQILEIAREKELHTVIAAICTENIISISFYKKLGFKEAGILREVGLKFGRWLDVVLYQIILK